MDVERNLISKIVQAKDFGPVAEKGITNQFFLDAKNRHVFDTLVHHHATYGAVPTVTALKEDHPDYKFIKVDDTYDYLIDKIREAHALSLLEAGITESVEAYEERNVDAAMQALYNTLNLIATDLPNSRDVDLTQTGDERFARYLALRELDGGLLGIPTGFDTINKATQGFQAEQLNVFVGPPKAGKSTLLLLSAIAAHMYGLNPLFFTFEMSNDEMSERMDSFRAGISNTRLREGSLKAAEWEKLQKYLKGMESLPPFILSADSMGATTLSGIAAKVDRYKPSVVFVDGVYLLHDEISGEVNTATALTNITRGLKRLAQNKQIPVNISTQVLEWKMDKKKGITSHSIGYSSSFAQDAHNVLGIERTDDPEIQKVKVVLSRTCPPMETYIKWDWEHGTFEELTGDPFTDDDGGWDDDGKGGF